jgi:hypothetical protein
VELSAEGSSDPDGDALSYRWEFYPEPGTYRGPLEIVDSDKTKASFVAPSSSAGKVIHVVLTVTDRGEPPLTRYGRIVTTVEPR